MAVATRPSARVRLDVVGMTCASCAGRFGYGADKDALIKRLHRIEGQVRGVERMVQQDRHCTDILTQIAAARTALEQVGSKLLEGHVTHCVADAIASGDEKDAITKTAEMLDAVQRFVKTT